MENEKVITITNMEKKFPIGGGFFTALKGINLSFDKGEFTGLVGPSGSGKTTLLNIVGSLDVPTGGQASILGHDVGTLTHRAAARLRNDHIGFIFQTYNLLPVYSVFDNVQFPLLLKKMSADERKKAVNDALEWVGLTDKAKSKPAQLSGGESQRVAIAR
ncbi:MAG: ABC transporter ATP-binding protein, partial [Bacteroidetes bacterium]|nr:ABC transporter ATP-binding protein [Bacteroidota bacterium]